MLFGRDDGIDAQEFWKEREEDLGTAILARTLGQVIRKDSGVPLWGMFYTTDKALYFQTFYSDNWLSAMFSGGKKSGRTKDEIIEIPAGSIEYFRIRPRKKRLLNLFHQPEIVELRWKSTETGETKEMVFETDGDAQTLVSSVALL